jgi:hypothetical protein
MTDTCSFASPQDDGVGGQGERARHPEMAIGHAQDLSPTPGVTFLRNFGIFCEFFGFGMLYYL